MNALELNNDLVSRYEDQFEKTLPGFADLIWKLVVEDSLNKDEQKHCLTYIHTSRIIGIVTKGKKGYSRTNCKFLTYDHNSNIDVVAMLNVEIFELDEIECMKMTLKSM